MARPVVSQSEESTRPRALRSVRHERDRLITCEWLIYLRWRRQWGTRECWRVVNRIGIWLRRLRFSGRSLSAKHRSGRRSKGENRRYRSEVHRAFYYRIWLCPGRHCPHAIADSHDELSSSLMRTMAFSPFALRVAPASRARTPPAHPAMATKRQHTAAHDPISQR